MSQGTTLLRPFVFTNMTKITYENDRYNLIRIRSSNKLIHNNGGDFVLSISK